MPDIQIGLHLGIRHMIDLDRIAQTVGNLFLGGYVMHDRHTWVS